MRGLAWVERTPRCPPDPAPSQPAQAQRPRGQFPLCPHLRPTSRRRKPKPQQGPRDRFTPFSFTSEFHGCLRNSFLRLWCLIIRPKWRLTQRPRENCSGRTESWGSPGTSKPPTVGADSDRAGGTLTLRGLLAFKTPERSFGIPLDACPGRLFSRACRRSTPREGDTVGRGMPSRERVPENSF